MKVVIVGDGAVGKTCLILSYTTKAFPSGHVPVTVMDTYTATVRVDEEVYEIDLVDTAGPEGYDVLRPMCYPYTDVFLVCFSVMSPVSFENVRLKWVPEVRLHCPKARFILVGLQTDLREAANQQTVNYKSGASRPPISFEEGATLAREIKAVKYVECSARTQKGLQTLFQEVVSVWEMYSAGIVQKVGKSKFYVTLPPHCVNVT